MPAKKLSNQEIKALEPGNAIFSRADGDGLRIIVDPNGTKRWESKIYLAGKEIRIGLGVWPEVSPDEARKVHAQYRAEARAGRDPRDLRKPAPEEEQTFEALFWGWFEAKAPSWKDYHAYQTRNIGNLQNAIQMVALPDPSAPIPSDPAGQDWLAGASPRVRAMPLLRQAFGAAEKRRR